MAAITAVPRRFAVSTAGLLLVALVIFIGLVGVVVPVLPGALLVLAAMLVWAVQVGSSASWATFAVAAVVIGVSQVAKYVVPGRRLAANGVRRSTLLAGAVTGIVGFFVVPIVGLPLGFVLAVYVVEYARNGRHAAAWSSTKAAVLAVGLSMLIELVGALLASAVWLTVVTIG